MKILGIDPGTVSFDLCLLDDDKVTFEDSIPSSVVAERPEEMAETCLRLKPMAIIAPSGYGLPNRHFNELSQKEMFELTLVREGENVPVLDGMKKFFSIVKEGNSDILFVPGIIQLPTVPRWRKFNKIDMGTADKMCIGALSVEMVSRKKGVSYAEVSHVVVELGGGYNSAITIDKGRIINGIGGTLFPGPGFVNAGAMDGEIAYLVGGFEKTLLFQGGASQLANKLGLPIEDFTQESYPEAFNAFVEGILFAICSQQALLDSREVYLSGRLTGYENIYRPLKLRLEELGYAVSPLPTLSNRSKAAAQGYAMVGNGLYGGRYHPLVTYMMIDKAEGSVTDYIYWKERV
ncbi:MAG: DUF1464 family protein [Chloroflexota bacterium]|nr:DUF1464 family protein [Chloroflexota bacterium]